MWIKVTGPVSFIQFSFPVEAGQLTWSLLFCWFWLVIMCYVVKVNFIGQWHLLLDFHWLFNGPIMWPVRLQAPGNWTGQIGQFWSYNSKISYKYGLLRTNQIHIKHFLIDTIKEGNRLVDVSFERELIVPTAQTLCSMDGKNRPQNSRATGWTIEQHQLVCTR